MLRGAIIGLGNIAIRGHVPAFLMNEVRRDLQIIAVLDAVEQNRERASELLPNAAFYTDVNALLRNEQIDFVDVCTPPHTHAEYVGACASKGIHIVCEKPLTERYFTALELADVIKKAGIVFVPCHQYKFSPLWRTIGDMIKSDTLGRVTLAQFNVYRLQADSGTAAWKPEWRTNKNHSGGGILVDTGAHYLYLAQYFFGGLPTKLSAVLRTLKHRDYGVEDTALVTLEYPETLMQINLTWAASQRANSAYIVGTKGSLAYDGARLVHTNSNGAHEIPMPDVSDKNQYIKWYAELFDEFVCRIAEKNTSTDLLEESLNVMKLLDACSKASEQSMVVSV